MTENSDAIIFPLYFNYAYPPAEAVLGTFLNKYQR